MMTTSVETEPVSRVIDDKSPICIPFILARLKEHKAEYPRRPFVIGLNGVQGVGKTTLVKALAETLQDREELQTLVCSIDDFYLTHDDQLALAEAHPDNLLVQHRGEPGTHDLGLAQDFFSAIIEGKPTHVPQYDKSAFSGQGDRVPESQWQQVNGPPQSPVQVVLLEGWCVGFRALNPFEVEARWKAPSRTLQTHKLEHLLFVNEKLTAYDVITDLFDAFIHIDAENTEYVYEWRQEQEDVLRFERGPDAAMTEEQVTLFVDGYYPAYELFADGVRRGIFTGTEGRQLHLAVGKNRRVKDSRII